MKTAKDYNEFAGELKQMEDRANANLEAAGDLKGRRMEIAYQIRVAGRLSREAAEYLIAKGEKPDAE